MAVTHGLAVSLRVTPGGSGYGASLEKKRVEMKVPRSLERMQRPTRRNWSSFAAPGRRATKWLSVSIRVYRGK